MAINGKPIRFAALIRVSTEKQKQPGESLRTRAAQIDDAGPFMPPLRGCDSDTEHLRLTPQA